MYHKTRLTFRQETAFLKAQKLFLFFVVWKLLAFKYVESNRSPLGPFYCGKILPGPNRVNACTETLHFLGRQHW